jgi:hypothetical protein
VFIAKKPSVGLGHEVKQRKHIAMRKDIYQLFDNSLCTAIGVKKVMNDGDTQVPERAWIEWFHEDGSDRMPGSIRGELAISRVANGMTFSNSDFCKAILGN